MITFDRRVAAERGDEFRSLRRLLSVRRPECGRPWAVYDDVVAGGTHVETYLVGPWVEHQRQGERRITVDRAALDRGHYLPTLSYVPHCAPSRDGSFSAR